MNFENLKLFYLFSCILLGLVILSPTLFEAFPFPEGDHFTELWLLGENHMIESGDFFVTTNNSYSVHLGVLNNMRDLEFYKICVKFRTQSDPLPDRLNELPSPLEPLFEYYLFLENNEIGEKEFRFSFENILFEEKDLRILELSINGYDVGMDKIVIWDEKSNGLYCQFFFELWIYNSKTSSFQFHNRYVSFWVNLIQTL